jgi:adenylate cyclase
VVAIDKPSADRLKLPVEPEKWPRRLHAQLIDRLADAGASVIAVDIFFAEARNVADDAALAKAIARAGNVVLFAYTKKELSAPPGKSADWLVVQRLVPPVAPIAEAARALAPFPLPVFPVKVSQFWTFTPATGDLPTLPSAALQLHAASVYPDLRERIARAVHGNTRNQTAAAPDRLSGHALAASMRTLRSVFRDTPELSRRLSEGLAETVQPPPDPRKLQLLRALIGLYGDGDSRYVNFYGPARSITTLSYARVLRAGDGPEQTSALDLRGKAVFVGYSERLQPERLDQFFTAFSQPNGVHLSGVEIAATAFANLLENQPVTPLPRRAGFALLFAWGCLVGALARRLPALPALAATTALAALYLGAAHVLFDRSALWLPLLVPLFLQVPFALFSATFWHYLEVRRERERIRTAFGYYLPASVIDRLAGELAEGRAEGQLMYGVCLYSDAERYTTLSEGLAPEALAGVMNRYYETLFRPVREQQGIISDVVGDAMLAIWTSRTPERSIRRDALVAATQIDTAVNRTARDEQSRIPATRLGLHSGEILLGSIGAIDHYEYRAVGDIVNSASRIQELNKTLGTRALVSAQVLEGIGEFLTREVGTFLLRGKTRPLVIHELIGCRDAGWTHADRRRQEEFAQALAAFRGADWEHAVERFTQLVNSDVHDGVARFYLDLSLSHRQKPPGDDWDGVIRLD